jgi:hypothetical protein
MTFASAVYAQANDGLELWIIFLYVFLQARAYSLLFASAGHFFYFLWDAYFVYVYLSEAKFDRFSSCDVSLIYVCLGEG